ncbi:Translation initiation factor IF-2 [Candidatus Xenohaliotis californiensis]|uniref:Translation initiation factor IF-2 n=1 Tax=Candidatus Xenohaliotis californiensis TaxID=84677 RepID=A0ABM9N925_9RICK|nr:Translation initiation factor IF-2 [Candidatus Xenohaliotis californiensis]
MKKLDGLNSEINMASSEMDGNKKGTLTLNRSDIVINDAGEFIRTGSASKSRVVKVVRRNRSKNDRDVADIDLSNDDYDKRKKVLEKSISDEYQKKMNVQLSEDNNTLMALHSAFDNLPTDNIKEKKEIINSNTAKDKAEKQHNLKNSISSKDSGAVIKNDIDVIAMLSTAQKNDNALRDSNKINGKSDVGLKTTVVNKDSQEQSQDVKNAKQSVLGKRQDKLPYSKKSSNDKDANTNAMRFKKSTATSNELVDIKNWRAGLDQTNVEDERTRVRELFNRRQVTKRKHKITKNNSTIIKSIDVFDSMTIDSLAKAMSIKMLEVKKIAKSLGIDIANDFDVDSAQMIVESFGHKAIKKDELLTVDGIISSFAGDDVEMKPCPPVVTVMGHVDHGKTSLLDAIRQSSVTSTEIGGITQRTAAYQACTKSGSNITFIDTPGHEAFTDMRLRGANVTNLVVLVVAADDGVMPQTIEAINHAKAANVPIIVAVNKIDKDGANVQKVLSSLLSYGIVAESMGGEVLTVEVSALKAINLDVLENIIILQSEISGILANYKCPAHGVVLESKMVAGKGSCVSVLVKGGILHSGSMVVSGGCYGLVRSMTLWNNKRVTEASPATPVELVGLNGLPKVGEKFVVVSNNKMAKEIVDNYHKSNNLMQQEENNTTSQIESFFVTNTKKNLDLVIKADSHGSCEAVLHIVNSIENEEVDVNIIHHGIGDINESDVLLATISKAKIIAFNVSADSKISSMAKLRSIQISIYQIIYDIINDIKNSISAMLSPIVTRKQIATVSVRKVFAIDRMTVAGSYVLDGIVKKDMDVDVLRNGNCIYQGKIKSLQRSKNSVQEVNMGFECGIAIAGCSDIDEGDVIKVYEVSKQKRVL